MTLKGTILNVENVSNIIVLYFDFRGNRSKVIRLNSPNIKSKIWRRSLCQCARCV